jgi:hypothetical protein
MDEVYPFQERQHTLIVMQAPPQNLFLQSQTDEAQNHEKVKYLINKAKRKTFH